MFPSFVFLNKTIGVYSVLAAIGFFVAYFSCCFVGKNRGINKDDLILAFVSCGIGLLVGGHFLYFLTNVPALIKCYGSIKALSISNQLKVLKYVFSGNVFYGGFVGGALGIFVFSKIIRANPKTYFDLYAFSIPLFHFFGRIGCFFAGCCYGAESDWGFIVHNNVYSPSINDVRRIPIQLIEAVLNLVIFFIIDYFYRKNKFQEELLFVYMILYPLVRFFDEFFRGDTYRGFILGLSVSQWISVVLIIISATHFLKKYLKNRNIA